LFLPQKFHNEAFKNYFIITSLNFIIRSKDMPKVYTINEISLILGEAVKEVLKLNTGKEVKLSPTIQKIGNVALRPDISSFLDFYGDYNGLICMNFSKDAALELCRLHFTTMGFAEEDLPKDPFSDEVINFIGEMTNQIAGNFRKKMEEKFGLSAKNPQPKALQINHTIQMFIESALKSTQCRKLSFSTPAHNSFYAELSLEKTEFILMEEVLAEKKEEESVDKLLSKFF
jgi:CheY-specific phosphatase CheX